jgi:hypothetical protein
MQLGNETNALIATTTKAVLVVRERSYAMFVWTRRCIGMPRNRSRHIRLSLNNGLPAQDTKR